MTEFSNSNWAKTDFVQQYRENADIYIVERDRMFRIMKSFYRHFLPNRNNRILDLGCGDGIVTHNLISVDDTVSATLIDASEEMLKRAKERLNIYKNINYMHASFQDIMREGLPEREYDFIVSSMAIHHLTQDEKRGMLSMIHTHLKDGGFFLNIDVLIAPTPFLENWYMLIWEEWMDEKRAELGAMDESSIDVIRRYKDAEENQPDTLDILLSGLKEAGFREVDCYYKYGIFVVYGGMKRSYQ